MPRRGEREGATERDGNIVALHAAFALMGVATAMPGAVLPLLSAQWSLHDSTAGLLFAAQFSGGAIGGLLTRKRFFVTAVVGLCLVVVAASCLGLARGLSAAPLLFFYGVGDGLTTTSTSMMIGRRYQERRGAALSLLNFSWSVGAAICPLLMARLLQTHGVFFAFHLLAGAGALATVSLLLSSQTAPPVVDYASGTAGKAAVSLVAFFALLAFLYVGIESSIGGWISTFAERAARIDAKQATAMASFFWGALLLGRGLSSMVLLHIAERSLYIGCLACGTIGTALLLSAHSVTTVGLSAVIVGLSLAPLFPLNLSLFLSRAGEFSRAGITLAISGFGGAVLPWLTGVVSNRRGRCEVV